tara:strand:- start:8587 stop:8763 length:177 start_codon:yes stop_codon:yes gene_type:complete
MLVNLLSFALAFAILGIINALLVDNDLTFALAIASSTLLIVAEIIKHFKSDGDKKGDQ